MENIIYYLYSASAIFTLNTDEAYERAHNKKGAKDSSHSLS